MNCVLTICSANYIGQAKTLADSVVEHNPGWKVVICLVDMLTAELARNDLTPHQLLAIADVEIQDFTELVRKYDIVELNTAVKPFVIDYLYRSDPTIAAIVYFDPDILVLRKLDHLEAQLKEHNLVVTPHSCTTNDSEASVRSELAMLMTGIYNLGFLGTRRSATTLACLTWWQKRLREYCFYAPERNLFVDQIWMILAPHFFPGVFVDCNLGNNVCYWNLFERRVGFSGMKFTVNDSSDLNFYHFSSYNPKHPDIMAKRYNIAFPENAHLRQLFAQYQSKLMANGFLNYNKIPYGFAALKQAPQKAGKFKQAIRASFRYLPENLRRNLQRVALFVATCCVDVKPKV